MRSLPRWYAFRGRNSHSVNISYVAVESLQDVQAGSVEARMENAARDVSVHVELRYADGKVRRGEASHKDVALWSL
jgi:hypothetical protein